MLEQFFVPLNPATDITNCEATVRLKLTGGDVWVPSLDNDDLWDDVNKQMAEVFQHYYQNALIAKFSPMKCTRIIQFFQNALYIVTVIYNDLFRCIVYFEKFGNICLSSISTHTSTSILYF